ncbi:fimbrial protein [Roseateles sp.]|uniref:fimbrial protein n=1 Tax=Roseateles sp. TaxID=1971397 RepID=UPI002E060917|nr:fimbrial protein [Roseateles sp.]HEV6965650.1 fimbrial protein [Roseateles sp.]
MQFRVLAAAAAAIALSQAAQASDGTITFNGNLVASTCTITGGGNQTVTLPTLSTSTLASAGATAGDTLFTIALTGCTGTQATTFFEAGANTDATTGRLKTNATNVQIQLLTDAAVVVNLAGAAGSQNIGTVDTSTGSGSQSFIARYYATGATSAGAVSSSVTYSMIYN